MATRKEQIIKKALEIMASEQNGLRYTDLVKRVHESLSNVPINTVHGIIWNLETRCPDEIYKPSRGIFKTNKI